MSAFKPFPELVVEKREEGVARVATTNGSEVLIVIEGDEVVLDRMVNCWNACRKLYNPAGHIEATDEYVKRLEQLRKDAWARAETLQAQVDVASAPAPEQAA